MELLKVGVRAYFHAFMLELPDVVPPLLFPDDDEEEEDDDDDDDDDEPNSRCRNGTNLVNVRLKGWR